MTTHRLLPATALGEQTRVINGRSYTATPGETLDVPDFDSGGLQANGWVLIAPSGPSSERPTPKLDGTLGSTNAGPGAQYFDSDLDALIICDGVSWRSPSTGAEV